MKDQAKGSKRINSSRGSVTFKRSFAIRSVGSYVSRLTQPAFRKHSPLLVRLMLDWEQFVGSRFSKVSMPKRLHRGVLTISCHGPMAIELHYNMRHVLERINTSCGLLGENRLSQLKIIQDQVAPSSFTEKHIRPQPSPVPIEGFEEGPLKEALERLGGQVKVRSRR